MDQLTKEKLQVTTLLINQGTPVSQISGRDLPSPAEIRADTNMLLLPYYQEVIKNQDQVSRKKSRSSARNNLAYFVSEGWDNGSAAPVNIKANSRNLLTTV